MMKSKVLKIFKAFIFSYTLFSISSFLIIFGVAAIQGSLTINAITSLDYLRIFAVYPWIFTGWLLATGELFGFLVLIPTVGFVKAFYDEMVTFENKGIDS